MASKRAPLHYALSTRFTVLFIAVLTVAALIFLAWSWNFQVNNTSDKVLAEARTLNLEILAAWDYVDSVQDNINYNSDGSYDFKGVYCSVAGKRIAQKFTQNSSGYVIRFVRENPRTGGDQPDQFEAAALQTFSTSTETEYYGIADFQGERVFRYLNVLSVKSGCLTCHGDPAGEKDVTGFIKEGMDMGDIGGAVSIVIPLTLYDVEARDRTTQTVLFFLVLMVTVVLIARMALRRWVTDSLVESNRQLEMENKAKSNYLAAMSHEMRTPLASIIAFTDIWEKKNQERGLEDDNAVIEVKENSMLLLDMVNNTIDVARFEAGHFVKQYDELDVVDVVNSAVNMVMPLARKRKIAVTKAIDASVPIIESDYDALRKIVINLVTNAVKYTEEGGQVKIRVSYDKPGKSLAIVVEDNGIGMKKDDISRIFDKYVQVGRRSNIGSTGSGLGLYLVKCFAEELGGGVSVTSAPGKGSVFTVTISAEVHDTEV